ncbi:MAG: phytanoyl-CoA dioxygenase family protein [Myxococcota bacterium]
MSAGLRLDAAERRGLAESGYLVRREVFQAEELEALREACEDVVDELQKLARASPVEMGSYVFEIAPAMRTVIKWEKGARDTVLGIEPAAHLHPLLEERAHDPRLVEPLKDVLACEDVCLYTEKLNFKRAGVGGPIALHQDYPYWVGVADDPGRIATAVLFLDDADRENGCLEVAPGSQLGGVRARREEPGFGQNEMDPERFDTKELVPLELSAGSVVFLGSLLVHRSSPNRSEADRRALLYSYQPAGQRHAREYIRIDPERGIEIGPPGGAAEPGA